MNILLEQLKAAEALEDEGLVNLIKRQIAYINYDHVPPETVHFRIHPDYYKVVKSEPRAKPEPISKVEFDLLPKGSKRKALLNEFKKKD